MTTTEELIAYHREWVRLHRTNQYQREGTRRMTEVLDALESARRDALQEARDAVLEAAPSVNAELMYDGSEVPEIASYVEGFRASVDAIDALIGDETGRCLDCGRTDGGCDRIVDETGEQG